MDRWNPNDSEVSSRNSKKRKGKFDHKPRKKRKLKDDEREKRNRFILGRKKDHNFSPMEKSSSKKDVREFWTGSKRHIDKGPKEFRTKKGRAREDRAAIKGERRDDRGRYHLSRKPKRWEVTRDVAKRVDRKKRSRTPPKRISSRKKDVRKESGDLKSSKKDVVTPATEKKRSLKKKESFSSKKDESASVDEEPVAEIIGRKREYEPKRNFHIRDVWPPPAIVNLVDEPIVIEDMTSKRRRDPFKKKDTDWLRKSDGSEGRDIVLKKSKESFKGERETPSRREETSKREKNPLRREETSKREKNPSRREETSRREKNPSRREETSKREKTPSRREQTSKPEETPSRGEETSNRAEASKRVKKKDVSRRRRKEEIPREKKREKMELSTREKRKETSLKLEMFERENKKVALKEREISKDVRISEREMRKEVQILERKKHKEAFRNFDTSPSKREKQKQSKKIEISEKKENSRDQNKEDSKHRQVEPSKRVKQRQSKTIEISERKGNSRDQNVQDSEHGNNDESQKREIAPMVHGWGQIMKEASRKAKKDLNNEKHQDPLVVIQMKKVLRKHKEKEEVPSRPEEKPKKDEGNDNNLPRKENLEKIVFPTEDTEKGDKRDKQPNVPKKDTKKNSSVKKGPPIGNSKKSDSKEKDIIVVGDNFSKKPKDLEIIVIEDKSSRPGTPRSSRKGVSGVGAEVTYDGRRRRDRRRRSRSPRRRRFRSRSPRKRRSRRSRSLGNRRSPERRFRRRRSPPRDPRTPRRPETGKNSKGNLDEFGVSAIMGMPLQDAFKFPHPLLEGVPKLKTENEQPKSVPAVGGGATVAATKSPATVFSKPQTLEKSPPTETPEEIITPPELEMDVETCAVSQALQGLLDDMGNKKLNADIQKEKAKVEEHFQQMRSEKYLLNIELKELKTLEKKMRDPYSSTRYNSRRLSECVREIKRKSKRLRSLERILNPPKEKFVDEGGEDFRSELDKIDPHVKQTIEDKEVELPEEKPFVSGFSKIHGSISEENKKAEPEADVEESDEEEESSESCGMMGSFAPISLLSGPPPSLKGPPGPSAIKGPPGPSGLKGPPASNDSTANNAKQEKQKAKKKSKKSEKKPSKQKENSKKAKKPKKKKEVINPPKKKEVINVPTKMITIKDLVNERGMCPIVTTPVHVKTPPKERASRKALPRGAPIVMKASLGNRHDMKDQSGG